MNYRYADRRLRSDVALPALPIWNFPPESAQMQICSGRSLDSDALEWVHHWRSTGDSIDLSLAQTSDGLLLRVPAQADFLVKSASSKIVVSQAAGVEVASVEHLLLDQVLPRVMAQQGEVILHAAAVDIDGTVVLLVANSGEGKSTLAAMLHRAGHLILSDDCVLLRRQSGGFLVSPTYRSLRLCPESISFLFPADQRTESMAAQSTKRRVVLPPINANSQSVSAIYFLEHLDTAAGPCTITSKPPAACCLDLIKQLFVLDPRDVGRARESLRRTAEFVDAVPAFRLAYRRDFSELVSVAEALVAHSHENSRPLATEFAPSSIVQGR